MYKPIKPEFIETKSGLLILIVVQNPETGEQLTFSYPDVIEIEGRNDWSPDFDRWYIHALNRKKLADAYELVETGADPDKRLVYRITFSSKLKS